MVAARHWMCSNAPPAAGSMYVHPSCNSWYVGANVAGKPRVFLPYVGGFDKYVAQCDALAGSGYAGCVLR